MTIKTRETCRTLISEGRKFTDADVTPELAAEAVAYVRRYSGGFDFLRDLQAKLGPRGLSTGQVRGVLNCVLAEERRNTPSASVEFAKIAEMLAVAKTHLKYPKIRVLASDSTEIVIGVAGPRSRDPGSLTVTDANERNAYGQRKWIGRISADGSFTGNASAAVLERLRELATDPERVAAEYGKILGNCCFCGRKLEDERSTDVGYGPVCAARFSLAWGKKSVA